MTVCFVFLFVGSCQGFLLPGVSGYVPSLARCARVHAANDMYAGVVVHVICIVCSAR